MGADRDILVKTDQTVEPLAVAKCRATEHIGVRRQPDLRAVGSG
jgi:hypothetical protein